MDVGCDGANNVVSEDEDLRVAPWDFPLAIVLSPSVVHYKGVHWV